MAPSKPTVSVDATALRAELRRIADSGLKKELRAANKSAAQVVVDKALPNVPVRTGRLRASVRALAGQTDARAAAGSASVPYAAAIHWGRKTRGVIQGRPFLSNAAQQHAKEVTDVYSEAIDGLFDNIRKG